MEKTAVSASDSDFAERRFPWRGMFLGCLMAFIVVSASIYYNTRLARQGISNDFLAACAIFFLIVICGVLNPLLKLVSPRLGFSGPELLVALSMMLVASAIPSWGLLQMWVSTITSWHYFASPENRWAELFIPHLPKGAVVRDLDAIKYLYEGLPHGVSIPWQSWVGPVAYWFPFFIALYLSTISLMVLFRKQWVEHERLAFPMMQFGMEMCRESNRGSIVTPFFRDRMVWFGAAVPFVILSYNGLAVFIPGLGGLSLTKYISVLRRTIHFTIHINFPAMGFAYLVGLDVSLGLWLFHVLAKLQIGFLNIVCGPLLSNSQVLYCDRYQVAAHEGLGMMAILFGYGVWVARRNLGRIFIRGLLLRKSEDDAHEIMSYRLAVWCLIIGLGLIVNYLRHIGLSFSQSVIFVFVAIIIFYAITRVICEGGVGFARAVYIPNAFMINQLGTQALGPTGITAMGFTFVWSGDLRTMVMAQAMQGMRLTEAVKWRRPMLLCFIVAILTALFGSLFTALHLGYKYGLFNCQGSWPVWPCGVNHWRQVAGYMQTPREPNMLGWSFIGIGGVVMWIMIFLRQRFVWWPVHYIGLPVCGSLPMQYLWFSVFLAWLAKFMIVKYGTTELYERSRMFFLGMIFGSLAAGGIWTVIGILAQENASFLRGVTLG